MKKLLTLAFACFSAGFTNLAAAESEDAVFDKVAEEYIRGYLSARPLQATGLGFHQYDGKINDYSRLAIDAEIARLQRFADRLQKFDATKLSPRASIDLRILLAAIKGDLFNIQDMVAYERNPMTYVSGFDVNIYIKRNFAPLEDRVQHYRHREPGPEHHAGGKNEFAARAAEAAHRARDRNRERLRGFSPEGFGRSAQGLEG